MKREKFLWPLTHGHQHGLMASRSIRERLEKKPTPSQVALLAEETRAFWDSDLTPHFQAEEGMLELWQARVGPQDPDLVRTLSDHRELGRLVESGTAEDLGIFARLLGDHIRFEEERLFGRLEGDLTAEQIKGLEGLLGKAAPACPRIPGKA